MSSRGKTILSEEDSPPNRHRIRFASRPPLSTLRVCSPGVPAILGGVLTQVRQWSIRPNGVGGLCEGLFPGRAFFGAERHGPSETWRGPLRRRKSSTGVGSLGPLGSSESCEDVWNVHARYTGGRFNEKFWVGQRDGWKSF